MVYSIRLLWQLWVAETQQCSLGAFLACVLQASSPEAAGVIFEIASIRHMGYMRPFAFFLGTAGITACVEISCGLIPPYASPCKGLLVADTQCCHIWSEGSNFGYANNLDIW